MFGGNLMMASAVSGSQEVLPPVPTAMYEFNNNLNETYSGGNPLTLLYGGGTPVYSSIGDNNFAILAYATQLRSSFGLYNTSDSSISIWFKNSTEATLQVLLIGGYWTFQLRISNTNDVYLLIYINGGWQYSSYIPVGNTDWFHIGISWDVVNKVAKFYHNGTLINTWNYSTLGSTTNNNLELGYSSAADFSGGSVDKFRIYQNTVLSDTDYTNIYNYELSSFTL